MPLMIKEFDGAKPELVKQEEKEVKTMMETKRVLLKRKADVKVVVKVND